MPDDKEPLTDPIISLKVEDVAQMPKSGDIQSVMDRYRFSGYQMPTVRLDDGFEYTVSLDHPSFSIGEPLWWHDAGISYGTPAGDNIDSTDYPSSGGTPIL